MSQTLSDVVMLAVGITSLLLVALAIKRFNARKAGLLCRRVFQVLWLPAGIVTGLAIAAGIYHCFPHYDPVRLEAWNKAEPRIAQTQEATKHEAEKAAARVKAFFTERKKNARSFASDLLSLSGKWAYVKSYVSEGSHEQYIQECFSRNVFDGDELKALIESSISSYVSEIQGRENQLLVAIRADLQSSDLASPQYLPSLGSDKQFSREYDAMLAKVLPVLSKDLGMTVSREVVSWAGSEIAPILLAEISASLATELGMAGSILGTGAASSVASLGLTIIIAVIIDRVLDWAIQQAGYDPEGEIAAKVVESLDQLERIIIEGDSAAKGQEKNATSEWSWSFPWSDSTKASAGQQSTGSKDGRGLKHQLLQMNEVRSKLREEALRALILKGGVQ